MAFIAKRRMKLPGNVELMAGDVVPDFETYSEKVRRRLVDMRWVEESVAKRGRPPKVQPEMAGATA
jgi:hypothetical protein